VCNEKSLGKFHVFVSVFGPLIISGTIITTWITSPSSVIFKQDHFILFAIYVGLLFGEMASDIILAHLTKSIYPQFKNIYYSLFVMALFVKLQDFIPG
jgi:hypothetical protein